MKAKQRPEFVAWEKLVLAQIESSENAIKCLTAEIQATKVLLRSKKRMLAKGRKDESAI